MLVGIAWRGLCDCNGNGLYPFLLSLLIPRNPAEGNETVLPGPIRRKAAKTVQGFIIQPLPPDHR